MSRANGGKPGRPSANDRSGEMDKISFRVDPELKRQLDALVSAHEGLGDLRNRRSALLRKLVMEAFAKLTDAG